MTGRGARHRNAGLRKVCECPRRTWPKCAHPWHFNYKWAGVHYRFSLDEQIGKHIDSKTLAETEAEDLRVAIRESRFVRMKRGRQTGEDPRPVRDRMTLAQLLALYAKVKVVGDGAGAVNRRWEIAAIKRVPLDLPTGEARAFGDWLVVDITAATLHQFRQQREVVREVPAAAPGKRPRRVGGAITTNRNLALLSAVFNWAIECGHLERTPFRKGDRPAIRLTREVPRSRRLEPGEGERLLAACGSHLRAVVEAALETGCRKGELLSLQWRQVRWDPRPELYLPAQKTKTRTARTIPISPRLKAILEMRRHDPAGDDFPPEAHVFGNAIGQRVTTVKTAWKLTCQRAGVTGLHFHDLRREAGSRWLEGGVVLHTVKKWLGHANISQTSTYLANTFETQHDEMTAFAARQQLALQRMATKAGKRRQKPPSSDKTTSSNPSKHTN